MGNLRLKGKDLSKIGYVSDNAKSLAINIISKYYKYKTKNEALELLQKVLESPGDYTGDLQLSSLAGLFLEKPKVNNANEVFLNRECKGYNVFGKKHISANTISQMEKAMLLPVAERGALMPDAHEGYGLPIGGVFATKNEVLPYAVGLDIGCRMSLTIFSEDERFMKQHEYRLKTALKEKTHFGIKNDVDFKHEHEVLERAEFYETDLGKKLHGKAQRQLGTSGSGNHFVEVGMVEIGKENNLNLDEGKYLGILSHSGSRGFGAEIAKTYTGLAMKKLKMPKGYQHLAWLDLNTQEGEEYWKLMNLAGDYAKACHEMIHDSIAKELKLTRLMRVENHHNFAWKEKLDDGDAYIVHRKGATPAGKGMLGIIPGSMTQPGYIVSGKGEPLSLSSASHGAGRKMTRTKAKNSITMSEVRKCLKQNRVTLIGGGVDEAPFVYKDLDEVIMAQEKLVNIEGKFIPKIVRMDKH